MQTRHQIDLHHHYIFWIPVILSLLCALALLSAFNITILTICDLAWICGLWIGLVATVLFSVHFFIFGLSASFFLFPVCVVVRSCSIPICAALPLLSQDFHLPSCTSCVIDCANSDCLWQVSAGTCRYSPCTCSRQIVFNSDLRYLLAPPCSWSFLSCPGRRFNNWSCPIPVVYKECLLHSYLLDCWIVLNSNLCYW